MMRFVFVGLLVFTGALHAAPVPKELKKAFKPEGTWEMISIDSYGNKLNFGAGLHWTLDEKGNMIGHVGAAPPSPAPKSSLQFTFHAEDKTVEYRANNGQRVCLGVYEFDGDTLKICCNLRGDARPRPSPRPPRITSGP